MRAGAIDAIFAAEFAAHGQDGGNDNDEEQVTAFFKCLLVRPRVYPKGRASLMSSLGKLQPFSQTLG